MESGRKAGLTRTQSMTRSERPSGIISFRSIGRGNFCSVMTSRSDFFTVK